VMGSGLVIFFSPNRMCCFLNKKNWENFGNFCFFSANLTNFANLWKNCQIFYITNLEEKKNPSTCGDILTTNEKLPTVFENC
jgi:hypothetical protein